MNTIPFDPTRTDRFDELTYAEQVVLWGMRVWACGYRNEDPGMFAEAREGLHSAGLSARGIHAIDALMTIIAISTTASIDMRCHRCTSVSGDEHRLIAAVAEAQRPSGPASAARAGPARRFMSPQGQEARDLIGVWLPPSAARMSRDPIADLALDLKSRDLILRERKWIDRMAIDGAPISWRGHLPDVTLH